MLITLAERDVVISVDESWCWSSLAHNLFVASPLTVKRFFAGSVDLLRINSLDMPIAIPRGQPVLLFCNYDLNGDELYSVKFYKDFVEFYRYLPSESEPGQKFLLKGAYVDVSTRISNICSKMWRPPATLSTFAAPVLWCRKSFFVFMWTSAHIHFLTLSACIHTSQSIK